MEKQPAPALVFDAFGIRGDRHAGELRVPNYGRLRGHTVFNERQWSAVSDEEVLELQLRLGIALPPGALGENLRFAGFPRLSKCRAGTRISFPSGAVLWVSGENLPCRKAAGRLAAVSGVLSVGSSFMRAAKGLRGIVGWVEAPGALSVGDAGVFSFG